jgi:pimeloyl-ACP methyl ester carboxylesterase
MAALPLPFLLSRLAGLISIVVLLSGLWFLVDGVEHLGAPGGSWFFLGVALLAFSLFGRRAVLRLLPQAKGREVSPLFGQSEIVTGSAGAGLHVEIFGPPQAPPIILTHGPGLDHTQWDGLVRNLAERYRVIVWDQPGLGLSGRPFDDLYSIERLGDDLRAVLQLAERRPAILVGHSTGALAVLALCRAHPELISKSIAGLVVMGATDAPVFANGKPSGLLDLALRLSVWLSPVVHFGAWASYLNGLALLVARATAFGAAPDRDSVDRMAWLGVRQAPSVQAHALEAAVDWAGAGSTTEIMAPLLVLAGAADQLVNRQAAAAMAASAPFGTFVELEGLGNLGMVERPDVYAADLDRWAKTTFEHAGRMAQPLHADVLRQRPEPVGSPEPEGRNRAPLLPGRMRQAF